MLKYLKINYELGMLSSEELISLKYFETIKTPLKSSIDFVMNY